MPRRILPIPPAFPVARLVRLSRVAEPLGVWLEAARPPVRLVVPGPGGRRLLLFASDLGTLLALAPRVAVWDGHVLRVIAARALARFRRLALRPEPASPTRSVVAAALGRVERSPPGRRDAPLSQPIDCVAEGRLA
ncbi:MAG TPA: hypothetical protein VIE46_03005 [Gemmatimonadales bacterium]